MPEPAVSGQVRPVAGCLFEVHLPGDGWSWVGDADAVSVLATGAAHVRFRAEREGPVELRFTSSVAGAAPAELRLTVVIAPEAG